MTVSSLSRSTAPNAVAPASRQSTGLLSSAFSSSQSRSGNRASWGFALRSSNPVVTGISGNGTSSTTNVRQMHNGGTWQFFNGGSFRFTPNGLGTFARTDLFPLTGNYRINGRTLSFSGSRSSSDLTSRNFSSIAGAVSLSNGAASINQRTVLMMAANVNNTGFSQTIDRTVSLNMRMVQIA